MTDPLDRIRETKDEAEALAARATASPGGRVAKITVPMLRKRVAQVLLAVHNRDRSKA